MSEPSDSDKLDTVSEPRRKQKRSPFRSGTVIFLLVVFSALVFFSNHEAVVTVDCTPEIIKSRPDIIMLGAWWCRYCYQAKRYFQQNNIHYCEYDMEQTLKGKQLYSQYGGGLPVLLIGEFRLNGFDERQIEAALMQSGR